MKLALCLVLSAVFVSAQSDPPARVGRLNYVTGPVSFQPAGETDWLDAPINRPLVAGDSLWTGANGRVEMHIGSTAIRLGAQTAFQLLNADDQTVQIRLSEGTMSVHVRELGQQELYEFDTPNLAFTVGSEGEYRVDANPDSQTTLLTIRNGSGEVDGGGQSFPLATRQQAVVTGDQQVNYRIQSVPVMDEFDQWCTTRDRREDQSQSSRYVSREMPGYEDLDQYGGWSNQPGYGNVWMPNSVPDGWAPYRDGQWVWIAPWGWTWVDDAPWGYAPYHYGRWNHFGNRWGWIPGPRSGPPAYAPALVGWVGGGGFSASVAWFALGPREPYFPSYQVSQGYFRRVNGANSVFNNASLDGYYRNSRGPNNTAIINIRYVNRNVRNGVVVVPNDVFASGRGIGQHRQAVSPAQFNGSQVFANPNIAPRRESVLGGRGPARGGAPPPQAFNRTVVARTAPPQAPVPFGRQQEALGRNGGRPLAPAEVGRMRGETAPPLRVRMTERNPAGQGRGRGTPALPPQAQQPVPPQGRQPEQRGNPRGREERVRPQAAPPQVVPPQAQPPQAQQPEQRGNPRGREERVRPQAAPPQAAPPQALPPQAQQPVPQQRRQPEQRGNPRGREERVQPQAAPAQTPPVQHPGRGQEKGRPERPHRDEKSERKQN